MEPKGQAPVNLAMIGLGAQAMEHLQAARNVPEEVRFVAGVDFSTETWATVQTLAPGIRHYADIAAMLADREALGLEGLVLALPHHAYSEVWRDLLSLGIPLLKEKPLGRNYEEAHRFLAQAAEAGCPLQTAIQRRHHPSYAFLREQLRNESTRVYEVHGHLHLGKSPRPPVPGGVWREDRERAGGGALLDAGYHLVDLVQYLTGPFEVVSSNLYASDRLDDGRLIEDRAWLTGRSEGCWVMLDTWVQGEPLDSGGFRKSEAIHLAASTGEWMADRQGVWRNGERLFTADNAWTQAMRDQLSLFSRRLRGHSPWQDATYWDQLPAMRVIEEAYRLSSRY